MTRNHSLDNAKAVLIILVIFGHLIEPFIKGSAVISSLYVSIYAFHMPAFVMITGMLTKNNLNNENLIKMTASTLVPFVIFSVLYEFFYWLLNGELSIYGRNLFPFWIMWFLISLFIWRLLLPSFLKLQYPVLVSLLLAIAAGYIDKIGYAMGLSRLITFFPLFLVGHLIAPKALAVIANRTNLKILLSAVGGALLLLFTLHFDLSEQWMYGSKSYALLGNQSYSGGLIRLALLVAGFVLSLALLSLMPHRKTILSQVGENSLYAYVWHGFFILVFSLGYIADIFADLPSIISLPVLFAASLGLAFSLSSSRVASTTHRLLLAPAARLLASQFKGRPERSCPKLSS